MIIFERSECDFVLCFMRKVSEILDREITVRKSLRG